MRKPILTAALLIGICMTARPVFAQQLTDEVETRRIAQTGMKFLSMSLDARGAALGDALTAQEGASVSMFYNPAGMAAMNETVNASLNHLGWFADIRYNSGAAAFRPANGVYGTFGISLVSVDYGTFEETIRADNEKGFIDTGTFSPSAMAIGFGYARELSSRFAVGANVKYATQTIGAVAMELDDAGSPIRENNKVGAAAVDFGMLYRTGFRSLIFAISARNFARELTYAEEPFELPLNFQIGVSMDVIDFTSVDNAVHSVIVAVDAQRPRDYYEQIKAGLEYTFMDLVSFRGGYVYPHDERGVNLGAGLHTSLGDASFGFDYAYTSLGVFGSVNRLTVQLGL